MAKQCKEMMNEGAYNIIDRSDKQVYNTKMKADQNRKKDAEKRKDRAKDGPPITIEPTPTPDPEYEELDGFKVKFVSAIQYNDYEALPAMIEEALNLYPSQLEELICWGELKLKMYAEHLKAEKSKVQVALDEDQILEIMFMRNLKGNLEPNMFGAKK